MRWAKSMWHRANASNRTITGSGGFAPSRTASHDGPEPSPFSRPFAASTPSHVVLTGHGDWSRRPRSSSPACVLAACRSIPGAV